MALRFKATERVQDERLPLQWICPETILQKSAEYEKILQILMKQEDWLLKKVQPLVISQVSCPIALRQVQRELGLDVVGSVTFGALSQEELTLALRVALPETMAGPDLIDWIDRKKDAQQKLSAYLLEQAYFFSEGDTTLKDWKKYKEDEQDAAEEAELEERRQEALRRQSGTNYDFTTMSAAELNEIDVSALTDDQFDAWEKRMDELGL